MNAYPYKENSKTPLLFSVLIALAALLMIYWVLNVVNVFSTPLPLPYSPGPAAHGELATPASQPAPLPVPTPAAPVIPQAQPVPTPPANP